MEDFGKIFDYESSFNKKNKLILSFYNDRIGKSHSCDAQEDLDRYEYLIDDFNRRMGDTQSYYDRISLQVEREKYQEFIMFSYGLQDQESKN